MAETEPKKEADTPMGPVGEALAFVYELEKQNRLSREQRERIIRLAIMEENLRRANGMNIGPSEELPEHSILFPGATNEDGTVRFSEPK